jgi:hypothetical protein
MYEALLRRMAEDVRAGGPCLAALKPHMTRSRMLVGDQSPVGIARIARVPTLARVPDGFAERDRSSVSVGATYPRRARTCTPGRFTRTAIL